MNVTLISVDPFSPVLRLEIACFPAVIGCDSDADVRVEARAVSNRHCMLLDRGGVLSVRDLKSEHGLLVNGSPETTATLRPDDTLTIGIRIFRVSYRERKGSNQESDGKPKAPAKVNPRKKPATKRSAESDGRGRVPA